jgi:hypothetical protein
VRGITVYRDTGAEGNGMFCDEMGISWHCLPAAVPKGRGIGLAAFRQFLLGADAMSVKRDPSAQRNCKTIAEIHGEFRGLYIRVASQAGVDQSYVSRVARGQRKSALVEELLRSEVKRILKGLV